MIKISSCLAVFVLLYIAVPASARRVGMRNYMHQKRRPEQISVPSPEEEVTAYATMEESVDHSPEAEENVHKENSTTSMTQTSAMEWGNQPRKPSWKDHPVHRAFPGVITPPVLAWYTTRDMETNPHSISAKGLYTQRASRYNLISGNVSDFSDAKRLYDYDVLALSSAGLRGIDNFVEFEITRDARVCLVLGVSNSDFTTEPGAEIHVESGYSSIGVAAWDEDSPFPRSHNLSSFQGTPIPKGYVACKQFQAGVHSLPSKDRLPTKHKVERYDLLFAESDGTAPELTAKPPGWSGPEIKQHELCPQELHDMWVVDSHDDADPQLKGTKWQTWHPQKDYLYGCYYGHEHGSPGMLAGYTERFHYTALKNGNQDEDHAGFKGYVLPVGSNYMYLNIHAETDKISRVNVQFHTMVIAITEKQTGNLLYEMSCKADFGGSGASYEAGSEPENGPGMLPVGNAETQKLITDTYMKPKRLFERKMLRKRINLLNLDNLDPRLRYADSDKRRGVYESWTGGGEQFCMNSSTKFVADGIEVDIRDAHTGCKDQACTEVVTLGTGVSGDKNILFPNLGTNRILLFRGIAINPENCQFEKRDVRPDGIFYTDQYCKELCDGPAPNCVRQVMKPEFKGIVVNDAYSLSDVHGHHTYQVSHSAGLENAEDEADGMSGVQQYEGALSITKNSSSE